MRFLIKAKSFKGCKMVYYFRDTNFKQKVRNKIMKVEFPGFKISKLFLGGSPPQSPLNVGTSSTHKWAPPPPNSKYTLPSVFISVRIIIWVKWMSDSRLTMCTSTVSKNILFFLPCIHQFLKVNIKFGLTLFSKSKGDNSKENNYQTCYTSMYQRLSSQRVLHIKEMLLIHNQF